MGHEIETKDSQDWRANSRRYSKNFHNIDNITRNIDKTSEIGDDITILDVEDLSDFQLTVSSDINQNDRML